jgi:hypothetical protein
MTQEHFKKPTQFPLAGLDLPTTELSKSKIKSPHNKKSRSAGHEEYNSIRLQLNTPNPRLRSIQEQFIDDYSVMLECLELILHMNKSAQPLSTQDAKKQLFSTTVIEGTHGYIVLMKSLSDPTSTNKLSTVRVVLQCGIQYINNFLGNLLFSWPLGEGEISRKQRKGYTKQLHECHKQLIALNYFYHQPDLLIESIYSALYQKTLFETTY